MTINEGEEHILTSNYAKNLSDVNLRALLNISNGNEEKADGSKWEDDVSGEIGLAVLAKIRKGFISRISDTVVYTERKLAESLDDLDYFFVNKRQLPPGPVMGTEENWLYIGGSADPSEAGDAWTITKNWKYSPDGWDEDIYP
jgi:hypothetical protein